MSAYVGEIILVAFNFAPAGYAFCDGQLLPIAENEALFTLIGTTYGGDGETTFALPDLRGRVPIHQGQGSGLTNFIIGEMSGVETHTLSTAQIPAHTHLIDVTTTSATLRCRNAAATTTSPVAAVPANEAAGDFTDPTLTPRSTIVKAVHVIELRSRIDSARIANGLAAFGYTDPEVSAATIKAQHIIDLRTALNAVYSALGQMSPTYTDPSLSAGSVVKAVHVTELRSAATAVAPAGTALRYSNGAADANMASGAIVVAGSPTAASAGSNQPHDNMQPFLTLNWCISLFGVFPSP